MFDLGRILAAAQKLSVTAFVFCLATLGLFAWQFLQSPTSPDPPTGQVVPWNGLGSAVYYITDAEDRIFRMANYGSTLSVMAFILVAVLRSKLKK